MSPRRYVRKTVDVWRFYVNYGKGWEYETTEETRAAMVENRRLYRENCPYPLRIRKVRERIEPFGNAGRTFGPSMDVVPVVNLESPAWDRAARDFTPDQ